MNLSESYSPDDSGHLISGVEVMVGFLFLLTILTLISYFVTICRAHHNFPGVLPYHRRQISDPSGAASAGPGLDQAALEAFPKLIYSKAYVISNTNIYDTNNIGKGINVIYSTSLSCSVCLADYDESDTIRVLPVCGHVFHLQCIDSWLRINPTCPLCRKLPSAPTSPKPRMNSV